MNARGQSLPILAVALVVMLVAAGTLLDGGYLWITTEWAQDDLDAAVCGIAAGAIVSTPATITITVLDVRGEYSGTTPTFLLQLVGFRELHYTVQSRCLRPQAVFSPICVKTDWFQSPGHTIVGAEKGGDQQADDNDYAGACMPWVQSQNTNMSPAVWYPPLESSQTIQPWKDAYRDAILGTISVPFPSPNTHIGTLNGVSNKFLVDAFLDAGIGIGDEIMVLEFSGIVDGTDPGEPPISNVEILGYAIFTITDIGVNWVDAEYTRRVSYEEAREMTRVHQIPWDWKE